MNEADDQSQWNELEADLRRDPREFGLATHRWDGPALSKFLRLRYGVELGVRQCQRIFRQLGSQPRTTAHTVAVSAPPHGSEMFRPARDGRRARRQYAAQYRSA